VNGQIFAGLFARSVIVKLHYTATRPAKSKAPKAKAAAGKKSAAPKKAPPKAAAKPRTRQRG
jgi:hypothetical protein